ncbi:MAG: ATP-dependent zinc metalloprotease FtsH [Armatimonadota bacterium]
MSRYVNALVIILFVLVIGYCIYIIPQMGSKAVKKEEVVGYTGLMELVRQGEVDSVTLVGQEKATGILKNGSKFDVEIPPDPELAEKLRQENPEGHAMTIEVKSRSFTQVLFGALGSLALPLVLLVLLWIFMMRQMQSSSSQALTFGRSRHKTLGDNLEKVTFEDVAGMEESKQELQEVVEFLRDPERFRTLGAKIPRGVLVVGPPGCGKTLLARAVAGEAGVQFFYISGSDFVEMFVGVGASRVRDLFDQAKRNLPAIVFIDEIDAVGRQRGTGLGGGHDEREQTLNALLVEMDGFDPNADVILLAATNRPDILDPALLRPGRFDRRVIVDSPDVKEREAILRYYTKKKPLAESVDVGVLARRTPGFTGADLESMANEAALIAARFGKKQVDMDDFDEAIDRVLAGPERKSRVISEKEKKILAYHEAGHALVANMLPESDPAYKVSILQRGMALGYTIRLPAEDRHLMSKTQLLDTCAHVLGGRAAEELIFGELTTGAQDDLEKVTQMAQRMVCEFGMSEKLGPMTFGRKHGPVFLGRDIMEERNFSESVAAQIDNEVRAIVDSCYGRARRVLQENRGKLDRLVEVLLEREVLDREEVEAVLRGEELPEGRAVEPVEEKGERPSREEAAPEEEAEGRDWKPATSTT